MEKSKISLLTFIGLYTLYFLAKWHLTGFKFILGLPAFVWIYLVLFGLGIVIWGQTLLDKWRWVRSHVKESMFFLLVGCLGIFVADNLSSLLVAILQTAFHLAEGQNDNNVAWFLQHYPSFITLPIVAVVGPAVEEFFFRQFLVSYLAKKSELLAIVVSAFLFAGVHMHGFSLSEMVVAVAQLGGALGFGFLFLKSGKNIWFPLILHSLGNLFIVLLF